MEAYDKGLEIINSGNIKNDYNKIYIHYAKLWIYSKLAYGNSLENKVNYKKLCFNEAKTCLSLIPENYSIWHFTDEGKFHEEVIRYSTNSIAWYLFKTSNEKSKMEYALDILETSCKTTSDPQYYYIFDTKVRILLKLKRRFEAYKIVNKILNKFPNFEDFQDFKTNTDYIYWLENIKD